MAEAVIKIIRGKKLARKIGEAGRKFVKEKFDWQAIVNLHKPLYDELVKNG